MIRVVDGHIVVVRVRKRLRRFIAGAGKRPIEAQLPQYMGRRAYAEWWDYGGEG